MDNNQSNHTQVLNINRVSKKYFLQKQKTFKEFLPSLVLGGTWAKDFWALKSINISLNKGDSLAVVGKNGAGKSTLLKLIAGVTSPTVGKIMVKGRVAPLIELGAGFHPELTGKENIYLNGSILGMKRGEIDKKYHEIVEFSELREFIDQPIKHYSSGMYMRLAFSVAIAEMPEILLIDEIFAVGDADFQKKCLDKLKEFQKNKVCMIIVSHSLEQIKNFCNLGMVLRKGEQVFFGEINQAIETYKKLLD
ncbi:hypothetical protein A2960_00760 [Candidatus Gottesmanbacteria bacterium RIFCSPLOWO2_01_FULL_39_12b]|uniref:ABC transporter domain-containing protein n=1 Tax=Candidatus Gottesmanbacteria bacterium RIFCSPLOWO2_01_FULL_39_12b TaxID=1798388 RepID=A0A1F6APR2_9BACT|nr:MAG: hypothetical protein A2960_00760 [Candidatus Gottesmanbacteria bacterium RIFCSPLOWO2_01_FULL_39_12b]